MASRYPSIPRLLTDWSLTVDATLTLGHILSYGSVRYGTLLIADETDVTVVVDQ